MHDHAATAADAARDALTALLVANDSVRMLDAILARLQHAAKHLSPNSRDGRTVDALRLSVARARGHLHDGIVSSPLTAWQTLVDNARHAGAREVRDILATPFAAPPAARVSSVLAEARS